VLLNLKKNNNNNNNDSDMIILDILNSEIPDLQIMNIYNEKSLKEDYNK